MADGKVKRSDLLMRDGAGILGASFLGDLGAGHPRRRLGGGGRRVGRARAFVLGVAAVLDRRHPSRTRIIVPRKVRRSRLVCSAAKMTQTGQ
jgi:hypothetical protein